MGDSNNNSFDNSSHASHGGQCKNSSDEEKEKKEKKKTIKVSMRVSVFFDGTGNNKTNTEIRTIFERELTHGETESDDSTDSTDFDKSMDEYIDAHRDEKEKIEEGFKTYAKKREDWKGALFDESFMNAYTNVVYLWRELKEKATGDDKDGNGYERCRKIYLDGIGTSEGEGDDAFQGTGFGKGSNGIVDRAEQAKSSLLNIVKSDFYKLKQNHIVKNEGTEITVEIDKLDIDVFGFSRGAAAARYFSYIAQNDTRSYLLFNDPSIQNALAKDNVKVDKLKMKFIGLFDTVSSFGVSGTAREKSNVKELKLAENPDADSIIHLCAIDEYRFNFALTPSIKFGGKDYYLPGVHSDIGGSYNDKSPEAKVVRELKNEDLFREYKRLAIGNFNFLENRKALKEKHTAIFKEKLLNTEIKWFTLRGWVKEDEVFFLPVSKADTISKDGLYLLESPDGVEYQVYLKRSEIRNVYSRIPLHFMREKAEVQKLSFNPRIKTMKDCGENELSPELKFLKGQIESSTSLTYFDGNRQVEAIRRNHLHFNVTLATTWGVAPYKGRFVNGVYERKRHEDG